MFKRRGMPISDILQATAMRDWTIKSRVIFFLLKENLAEPRIKRDFTNSSSPDEVDTLHNDVDLLHSTSSQSSKRSKLDLSMRSFARRPKHRPPSHPRPRMTQLQFPSIASHNAKGCWRSYAAMMFAQILARVIPLIRIGVMLQLQGNHYGSGNGVSLCLKDQCPISNHHGALDIQRWRRSANGWFSRGVDLYHIKDEYGEFSYICDSTLL